MPVADSIYRETHLLPSILSADFSRLGEQIDEVMDAGISMIHFDVMDGHFVPNLTVGPAVLRSISPLVRAKGGAVSAHLMIEEPEKYAEDFIRAGADLISFHIEASIHPLHTVSAIREAGARAGVALNPGTDVACLTELLPVVDFVLVMTVNPGFGGQELIAGVLEKIPTIRAGLRPEAAIEVDGGIGRDNIRSVVEAGGNWLVAGSAVFGAADPGSEARFLQDLARS